MTTSKITKKEMIKIDALVAHYERNIPIFERILDNIQSICASDGPLKDLIHSTKGRVKNPEHLRDKLIRKLLEAKEQKRPFTYTEENLFEKINDLAGFRILHLHTKQIEAINNALLEAFGEEQWIKIEGPIAKTWDDEYRDYFTGIGFQYQSSKNMYTSVHYVFQTSKRSKATCEIQVRTLMEEVWGEVDHKINYPHKSDSTSCKEQIKVLARVTSGCSRLVDSIFLTHSET